MTALTGKVSAFAPNAKIIHIDLDPAEIGKNVHVDVPIVGDVGAVLQAMHKMIESNRHIDWIQQLDEWRQAAPDAGYPGW